MSYQNKHLRPVRLGIIVLIIGLTSAFVSCNEGTESQGTATSTDDTTVNANPPSPKAFLGSGNFAYLALSKAALDSCFLERGHGGTLHAKKIVFRFSHDGSATSNMVIEGFLTNPNNVNYLPTPLNLLPALSNGSADLSGRKIYLSDLEMTRDQYGRIRASAPDDGYLIFIPFIQTSTTDREQHCVTYHLFWHVNKDAAVSTIPATFAPDNELNPSPPADPR